jgi:predicted permease
MIKICYTNLLIDKIKESMLQNKIKIYAILCSLLGHMTIIAAALYFCSYFQKPKTEQTQIYMVSLAEFLTNTKTTVSEQYLPKPAID